MQFLFEWAVFQPGNQYAIIVKYNDLYYSVLCDGSLEQVDDVYKLETQQIGVDLDYPLFWRYTNEQANRIVNINI